MIVVAGDQVRLLDHHPGAADLPVEPLLVGLAERRIEGDLGDLMRADADPERAGRRAWPGWPRTKRGAGRRAWPGWPHTKRGAGQRARLGWPRTKRGAGRRAWLGWPRTERGAGRRVVDGAEADRLTDLADQRREPPLGFPRPGRQELGQVRPEPVPDLTGGVDVPGAAPAGAIALQDPEREDGRRRIAFGARPPRARRLRARRLRARPRRRSPAGSRLPAVRRCAGARPRAWPGRPAARTAQRANGTGGRGSLARAGPRSAPASRPASPAGRSTGGNRPVADRARPPARRAAPGPAARPRTAGPWRTSSP